MDPRKLFIKSLVGDLIYDSNSEDISQAERLTASSTQQDFIHAVGIEPKLFFRIYHTLYEVLWNKNGSPTKFAVRHNIDSFDKLYSAFKDIKQKIRRDMLVDAWEYIREMCMVAYPKLIAKGLFTEPIYAYNFVQRTIWIVLDNLNILRKVFKIMQYMQQSEEYRKIMLALEKKFNAGIQKNEE